MNNTQLPLPDEPLVLADGTQIDGKTGKVIKPTIARPTLVEVPNNTRAQHIVSRVRRRLADLPAPPSTMNAVSVLLMYTLMGVPDADIASVMEIPIDRIKRIRNTDVYREVQRAAVSTILEQDSEDIRTRIAQNARTAVDKIADLLRSDDESVQLSAAKDVLDRAGHRPADIVEHRHSLEGGLVIEIIERKDETGQIPQVTIDVEVETGAEDGNSN